MKPDLFPGGGPYAGLFQIDFKFKPGDKILDVGGGHKPFPPSTHVLDFRDHSEQRHHCSLNLGGRELIEGDAAVALRNTPDKFFDFCYSNHTFEHIPHLPVALTEISRTCKRGFAAFPASDLEFISAKEHFGHVNLLRVIDDTIHVARRPEGTIIQEMALLWEELWRHPKFNALFEGHGEGNRGFRHIWEGRLYWEDQIKWVFHADAAEIYPQVRFFK